MIKCYLVLFLLFGAVLNAQKFPVDFVSPIDIPIKLVGNFGELRKNHFHSGLDIKTNEEEGHAIFSITEGFVSRISISAAGYGNAIYVDHPNGLTSVYAHLQQFNPTIAAYVKKEQYKQQKSEIELHPKKGELDVQKGEQIALSGNTGGSTGPHLHFEIRDTKTEDPINPFLFGFGVSDNKKPLLSQVYIYPIKGEIEKKTKKFLLPNNKLELKGFGKFGIGVKAYDQHDFLDNWNGIHSIKVYANKEEVYILKATRVSFSRPRIINIATDYNAFLNDGSWIYKCFKTEGNDLKMIEKTKQNGFIQLENNQSYDIKIEIEDFAGNQTTKEFKIIGLEDNNKQLKETVLDNKNQAAFYSYKKENSFKNENIELTFPKGVFSEDVNFFFKETNDGYEIHDSNYPALDYFTIKATPKEIAKEDYAKTIFARHFKKGRSWKKEYEGGAFIDGKIVNQVRDFGVYKFEVDKQAPTIISRMPKSGKVINQLRFTISDEMAGIQSYNVFIDNKWTLAVYDKKYKSLTINLEETVEIGNHTILIEVTDKVKNIAQTKFSFEKI